MCHVIRSVLASGGFFMPFMPSKLAQRFHTILVTHACIPGFFKDYLTDVDAIFTGVPQNAVQDIRNPYVQAAGPDKQRLLYDFIKTEL